jgi:hypothetical protein
VIGGNNGLGVRLPGKPQNGEHRQHRCREDDAERGARQIDAGR